MQDSEDGPLSAAELEDDARRLGRPDLKSGGASGGQDRAADQSADEPPREAGPRPLAGTMLPPD